MDKSVLEKELFDIVKEYNEDNFNKIYKAYEYALKYHNGQYRKSGEEYITHPLNVAIILVKMYADSDTICAGFLHDILEDTSVTKDMLKEEFNPIIANLVDGVTKLRKISSLSKEETESASTRKFSEAIIKDPRIIVIKVADRLHNMRTLNYHKPYKQKEISLETLRLYAPLADRVGLSLIRKELEDLSLLYLYPNDYKELNNELNKIYKENEKMLLEMIDNISSRLNDDGISNDIKIRTIHTYRAYKKISEGEKITDIHNLLALKVLVNEIKDCYLTLGCIHSLYKPLNSNNRLKDYIFTPKTNLYQSIHTTVFSNDGKLVQNRIRTNEMDQFATYGIATYWKLYQGKGYELMLNDMNEKFQFPRILKELNDSDINNNDFVQKMMDEMLSSNVYPYTIGGDKIELPMGSSIIDFAYAVHTDIGNHMIGALVNDKEVPINYILQNGDIVKIITSDKAIPSINWIDKAKTTKAKKKIKDFNNK